MRVKLLDLPTIGLDVIAYSSDGEQKCFSGFTKKSASFSCKKRYRTVVKRFSDGRVFKGQTALDAGLLYVDDQLIWIGGGNESKDHNQQQQL